MQNYTGYKDELTYNRPYQLQDNIKHQYRVNRLILAL